MAQSEIESAACGTRMRATVPPCTTLPVSMEVPETLGIAQDKITLHVHNFFQSVSAVNSSQISCSL